MFEIEEHEVLHIDKYIMLVQMQIMVIQVTK